MVSIVLLKVIYIIDLPCLDWVEEGGYAAEASGARLWEGQSQGCLVAIVPWGYTVWQSNISVRFNYTTNLVVKVV